MQVTVFNSSVWFYFFHRAVSSSAPLTPHNICRFISTFCLTSARSGANIILEQLSSDIFLEINFFKLQTRSGVLSYILKREVWTVKGTYVGVGFFRIKEKNSVIGTRNHSWKLQRNSFKKDFEFIFITFEIIIMFQIEAARTTLFQQCKLLSASWYKKRI